MHFARGSQSFNFWSIHSLTTGRHTRPGKLGEGETSAKPDLHAHV